MAEVGLLRRIAPAIILAAAGGVFLYLLPSSADEESGAENITAGEPTTTSGTGTSPSTAAASAGGTAGTVGNSGPRTITGDAVGFRFGTVQVAVVLDGTTITDIKTLAAPGGGYQPYTDRAIPTMKAEILKAQSTQVAAASGATYTSMAYAQSVQSALDRA